jgi:hypothetical protein
MNHPSPRVLRHLIHLAATRQVIKELQDHEAVVHAQCIKLMRRERLKQADLTPEHRALLERPTSTSIALDDYEHECLKQHIGPREYIGSIRRTVDLAKARKVLGEEAFDEIATKQRGKPRIRIVGTRGQQ